MNKFRRTAVIVTIFMLSATYLSAQVALGLRDNQYVSAGYTYHKSWNIKLEHSVFSQKLSTQYVRLMLGYKHCWNNIGIEATPYYGTVYNRDFYNTGVMLNGYWQMLRNWRMECTVNPHYDSGFDYETCFRVGSALHLYKAVSAVLQYSTIPEYRMKEKKIKAGLRFNADKLYVCPMLSIPVDETGKHVRLQCGFEYEF